MDSYKSHEAFISVSNRKLLDICKHAIFVIMDSAMRIKILACFVILYSFTFSIPCIVIQLLQFEPTNAHNFIKITIILQHTSTYMFQAIEA